MKETKDKLLRLSLQFFGESGDPEEKDDDFDDEFYDENESDDEESDFENENDGADDGADDDADDGTDDGADDDADDGANDGAGDGGDNNTSKDDPGANGDLVSELRALGYVGNDLAALTADMKAKREAKAAQEAKAQKAADKADGKAHVRSGVPGKSASGDGTGGINERQVARLAENTGCSKEEARQRLARHSRLISGG
jgi:hypothetical protein